MMIILGFFLSLVLDDDGDNVLKVMNLMMMRKNVVNREHDYEYVDDDD